MSTPVNPIVPEPVPAVAVAVEKSKIPEPIKTTPVVATAPPVIPVIIDGVTFHKYIPLSEEIEAGVALTDGAAETLAGIVHYKKGDALIREVVPDYKTTDRGVVAYDREYLSVIPADEFKKAYVIADKAKQPAVVIASEAAKEHAILKTENDGLRASRDELSGQVTALDAQLQEARKSLESLTAENNALKAAK